jgi:hypothetical protein
VGRRPESPRSCVPARSIIPETARRLFRSTSGVDGHRLARFHPSDLFRHDQFRLALDDGHLGVAVVAHGHAELRSKIDYFRTGSDHRQPDTRRVGLQSGLQLGRFLGRKLAVEVPAHQPLEIQRAWFLRSISSPCAAGYSLHPRLEGGDNFPESEFVEADLLFQSLLSTFAESAGGISPSRDLSMAGSTILPGNLVAANDEKPKVRPLASRAGVAFPTLLQRAQALAPQQGRPPESIELGFANQEGVFLSLSGWSRDQADALGAALAGQHPDYRTAVSTTPFQDYILLQLFVEGPDQQRYEINSVRASTPIRDVIQGVANKFCKGTASAMQSGRTVAVDLQSQDGKTRRVNANSSLHEEKVQDGDTLEMHPEAHYVPGLDFGRLCQMLVNIAGYRNYAIDEAYDKEALLWARSAAGQKAITEQGGTPMIRLMIEEALDLREPPRPLRIRQFVPAQSEEENR